MKNSKWVVFYPVGNEQISSIKFAKKLKYKIIGIDKNKKAKGRKYVDKFYLSNKNIPNIKFINNLKKKNLINVFSISSDVGLKFIKFLKNKYRLKHNLKDYDLIVNKLRIRKKLIKFNYNPKYAYFKNKKEIEMFVKKKNIKKFVIKPIYGSASRDVVISNKIKPFKKKIQNGYLIEKFIKGTEYTVDGIKIKNEIIFVMFAKKERSKYNQAVARSITTIDKNSKISKKIKKATIKILNILGIITSPFHLEFIINNNKIFLIDFAARSGGSDIASELAIKHSGFNISKAFISYELLSFFKEKINRNNKLKMTWLFNFEKNFKDIKINENYYLQNRNLKLITDKSRNKTIFNDKKKS